MAKSTTQSSNVKLCVDLEECHDIILAHELETNTRFAKTRCQANFGKNAIQKADKVFFEDWHTVRHGRKEYDGIPFVILSKSMEFECQFGPKRKKKKQTKDNSEGDHSSTKKLGCEAKIKIREVCSFPTYKRDSSNRNSSEEKLVCEDILARIRKGENLQFIRELIVVLPNLSDHTKHPVGPGEAIPEPIDPMLSQKIKEMVKIGIVDIAAVKLQLNDLVLSKISPLPQPTNKRYYPTDRTIRNLVYKSKAAKGGYDQIRVTKLAAAARCLLKGTQVLKKKASLNGKNLMELALQFKTTDQMPFPLARPKDDQRLQDMNDQELLALYYQITGEVPNNMFSIANREFNSNNLRLLLHLCIVSANAAAEEFKREQTHRSVRIKGTEENFIPEECLDMDCPVLEPHMHCPLCTNLDSYTDEHCLKNHFSIGHVKKALEFSGLKILRCLDDCDIVGRRGRKDLQKGHWHCYNCPNGFDKRADALKHYSHHMKNATSNLQITVNQDLYQVVSSHKVSHEINTGTCKWETQQAISNVTTAASHSKTVGTSSPLKRSYGAAGLEALETIDPTAVYVQEDGLEDLTETYTAENIPITTENDIYGIIVNESAELTRARTRIRGLEIKCNELEKENAVIKSHNEILQQRDIECSRQIRESKKEKENLTVKVEKLEKENEKLKVTVNRSLAEKRTAFELKDNWIRAGVLDRNRLKSVVQGQTSNENTNTRKNTRKAKVITVQQLADVTVKAIQPMDEHTAMLLPEKMHVKQSSLAKDDNDRSDTSEGVTLRTVSETSAIKGIDLSAVSGGGQTNVVSDKSPAKMGKVNKAGRNSSKSVTPTSVSISSQPSVTKATNDHSLCAEGKPPPKKVLLIRAPDDDKTDTTSKVKSSSIRSIRVASLKSAKKNKDTVTTESVPTASEPSLMEEMCNQLSSIRKEIALIKQATLTNSSNEEKE